MAADRDPALAANAPPGREAPSPALTPPPHNPRFPLFDSLRAIAVLAVVLFHATELHGALFSAWWNDFAQFLADGVLLFFVISGFLLYRPFLVARLRGRPVPIRLYARRRALRIIPLYWTILTLLAIWPGIYGVFTGDWYIYYGFLQSYDLFTFWFGIAPAWSLCVEAAFYVSLPLWAAFAGRAAHGRRGRAWFPVEMALLAAVAVSGTVVRILARQGSIDPLLALNLPGASTWLVLGMMLAVLSVRFEGASSGIPRFVARRAGLLWAAALAAFFLLGVVDPLPELRTLADLRDAAAGTGASLSGSVAQEIATTLLRAVMLSCLVLPAVFGQAGEGVIRRVLAWRALAAIGLVSYGIYLWHFPIGQLLVLPDTANVFRHAAPLGLAEHFPGSAEVLSAFSVVAAASAALAAITYRLVELPFLRRKEPRERA